MAMVRQFLRGGNCNLLQCNCNLLQCNCNLLQCNCNLLQCNCNLLQLHCICNRLQFPQLRLAITHEVEGIARENERAEEKP
jgi:hypothetical protein